MDKMLLGNILINLLEHDDDPRAPEIIEKLKVQMGEIQENSNEVSEKNQGPLDQVIGLQTLELHSKRL